MRKEPINVRWKHYETDNDYVYRKGFIEAYVVIENIVYAIVIFDYRKILPIALSNLEVISE